MTDISRVYNVPLRKEFLKVPLYKRTPKAMKALKQFLRKHMKSEDIRLSKDINDKMWEKGIRSPPHHIKVEVTKDDKGIVKAELFGVKKKSDKKTKKKDKKKIKQDKKQAKKEIKETKKVEDKKQEESKKTTETNKEESKKE